MGDWLSETKQVNTLPSRRGYNPYNEGEEDAISTYRLDRDIVEYLRTPEDAISNEEAWDKYGEEFNQYKENYKKKRKRRLKNILKKNIRIVK